jgi:hypothetical protein
MNGKEVAADATARPRSLPPGIPRTEGPRAGTIQGASSVAHGGKTARQVPPRGRAGRARINQQVGVAPRSPGTTARAPPSSTPPPTPGVSATGHGNRAASSRHASLQHAATAVRAHATLGRLAHRPRAQPRPPHRPPHSPGGAWTEPGPPCPLPSPAAAQLPRAAGGTHTRPGPPSPPVSAAAALMRAAQEAATGAPGGQTDATPALAEPTALERPPAAAPSGRHTRPAQAAKWAPLDRSSLHGPLRSSPYPRSVPPQPSETRHPPGAGRSDRLGAQVSPVPRWPPTPVLRRPPAAANRRQRTRLALLRGQIRKRHRLPPRP